MITVQDIETLPNTTEYGYFKTGIPGGPTAKTDGYLMASNDTYRMYFTAYRMDLTLASGAEVNDGAGWIIYEKLPNRGNLLPLTFITAGSGYGFNNQYVYSSMPLANLEEAVNAWNGTTAGEDVSTTEDVDERSQETIDAEEANAQRLREKAAQEAEEEEEIDRVPTGSPSVQIDTIIREETIRFVFDAQTVDERIDFYGESIFNAEMQIIQRTRGTEAAPVVDYEVIQRSPDSVDFRDGLGRRIDLSSGIRWSVIVETQEEAERVFDEKIISLEENFYDTQRENLDVEAALDSRYEMVDNSKVELYLGEFNVTIKEGIEVSAYKDTVFRVGNRYEGYWGDAATYSGSGKTLYLDDFDAPRVTTEGVQENPSGGVKIIMNPGFKANFELTTDSNLSFIRAAQSDIPSELIARDGKQFDFALYGGDRIEIDIDNERDSIRPFLVTVQGTEWYSAEEADDEIDLYMDPDVQVLMVKITVDKAYRNRKGELYAGDYQPWLDEAVFSEIDAPIISFNEAIAVGSRFGEVEFDEDGYRIVEFDDGTMASSTRTRGSKKTYELMGGNFSELVESVKNVTDEQRLEINALERENPMYVEMMKTFTDPTREITSEITQEGSFTSVEEVIIDPAKDALDDIGSGIEDLGEGIWDSIKWWVIGGVAVLAVVIIASVYVNARARRPSGGPSEA